MEPDPVGIGEAVPVVVDRVPGSVDVDATVARAAGQLAAVGGVLARPIVAVDEAVQVVVDSVIAGELAEPLALGRERALDVVAIRQAVAVVVRQVVAEGLPAGAGASPLLSAIRIGAVDEPVFVFVPAVAARPLPGVRTARTPAVVVLAVDGVVIVVVEAVVADLGRQHARREARVAPVGRGAIDIGGAETSAAERTLVGTRAEGEAPAVISWVRAIDARDAPLQAEAEAGGSSPVRATPRVATPFGVTAALGVAASLRVAAALGVPTALRRAVIDITTAIQFRDRYAESAGRTGRSADLAPGAAMTAGHARLLFEQARRTEGDVFAGRRPGAGVAYNARAAGRARRVGGALVVGAVDQAVRIVVEEVVAPGLAAR